MAVHSKLQDAANAAENARDDANDALNKSGLKAEAEQIARTIRSLGADGLAEVRKLLGDKMPAVDLPANWDSVESRVADELRQHPLRTLGVVALAGLALGLVLRR